MSLVLQSYLWCTIISSFKNLYKLFILVTVNNWLQTLICIDGLTENGTSIFIVLLPNDQVPFSALNNSLIIIN